MSIKNRAAMFLEFGHDFDQNIRRRLSLSPVTISIKNLAAIVREFGHDSEELAEWLDIGDERHFGWRKDRARG